MYQKFYHLKKPPFNITPDPEFLSLGRSHREALASIQYGVEHRKGFIVITGEVGVGKTMILRAYLKSMDRKRLRVVYLFHSSVTFRGLLKTIFRELDRKEESEDVFEMVNRLHELLIEEYRQGNHVALLVDEAQNMPIETLENLRMLSNLETSTEKLLQIVLVGQSEFEQTLNLKNLRQLKQRVAVHFRVPPLTEKESVAYIQHRLAKAAARTSSIFTHAALREIVRKGGGIPRNLNTLCDNSLLTGLGYQAGRVNVRIVREVIRDLEGDEGKRRPFARRLVFTSAAVFALTTALLWFSPIENPFPVSGAMLAGLFRDASTRSEANGSPENRPLVQKPVPAVSTPPPEGREDGKLPSQNERKRPPLPSVRIVKEGDSLSGLAKEIYGFSNPRLVAWIKKRNPNLKNADRLQAGERILFPEIDRTSRGGR